jgi:2-hydroxychromene-2-carboxylate isomerase
VEFWFEFASTYSHPAAQRVEARAREAGATLRWRPFLLGPIFRELGWSDSPFNLQPAKGRYMWRDLERTCAAEGLPFRRPSRFPRNGLAAARVACWFEEAAWLPAFVRAVFLANFAEDRDIADPVVLADCLGAAGTDPDAALARAASPEAKAKLRTQTERARELGIFGAPTFVVDGELFWGNDRLDAALAWSAAARAPGSAVTPAVRALRAGPEDPR